MDEQNFTHPVTGELLQGDSDEMRRAAVDADGYLRQTYRHLGAVKEQRDRILAHVAGEPYEVPQQAWRRTDKQQAVSRCPRCNYEEAKP